MGVRPPTFRGEIRAWRELIGYGGPIDRLRWYCRAPGHEAPTVIREESFHVTDLGAQLKPIIDHWIADEASRRCPSCGTIAEARANAVRDLE